MNQLEYDFCLKYVGEFLTIINYPVEDNTVGFIEKYREQALIEADKKFKDSRFYDTAISAINADYNSQIFDYIKEKVVDIDPEFFNERISNMNKLLLLNKSYAERLGMTVPARTIDDYYNNYLLALERTLRADLQSTLIN